MALNSYFTGYIYSGAPGSLFGAAATNIPECLDFPIQYDRCRYNILLRCWEVVVDLARLKFYFLPPSKNEIHSISKIVSKHISPTSS